MTVIVAVRKGARAAIAADSQFTQGPVCIPGEMHPYPPKIHLIAGAHVGVAGSCAHHSVLRSLVRSRPELFNLANADEIFETFRRLHPILREEYFLMTKEDTDDQEYESNQMTGMILSPGGIFSFQGYREISAYRTFWSAGSGMEIALGALDVLYRSDRSARDIAIEAVTVACRFDRSCGPPIECHEIELAALDDG